MKRITHLDNFSVQSTESRLTYTHQKLLTPVGLPVVSRSTSVRPKFGETYLLNGGSTVNVVLPKISTADVGALITLKNHSDGTGPITILPFPGATIDGAASKTLTTAREALVLKAVSTGLWIALGPSYTAPVLYDYVFVCGAGGNLWKSSDGGVTFTQITTGIATELTAIWGTNQANIYVGTADGKIYLYNGSTFTLAHNTGYAYPITDINGNSDGTDIWAGVYYAFTRANYNGSSWTSYSVSGNPPIAVAGFLISYVVGANLYPTSSIRRMSDAAEDTTSPNLINVSGLREASDRLWLAGANGYIYYGEWGSWAISATGKYLAQINFHGGTGAGNQIWVSSDDKVWIVSGQWTHYYNGSSWTSTDHGTPYSFGATHGINDSKVWFLSRHGTSNHLVKWNGATFGSPVTVGSFYPNGIWTIRA